jgi:hypothetical protein
VIARRCATHLRVNCATCELPASTESTAVNPYAEPEGAEVRGNAHAGETGYWASVREKAGFSRIARIETLVDLFFVVWFIDFVTAIVLLITSL